MSAVKSGLFSLGGGLYKVVVGLVGAWWFGRLVSNADFGIYTYILAIHLVVLPFLDFGLLPAYLKIEKVDKEVNSVFFSLNVVIGLVLTAIVIIIAPFLAAQQDEPMLTWYILTYSLLILIISLGSQPSSQLIKQKRFKEIALIDGLASTVALVIGVFLALWGWAVWALLLRFIIDVTIKLGLQCYQVRPSYSLVNKTTIKKYWKSIVFGGEIAFSRIISGFTSSTDKFLFKEFYQGFDLLGHYGRAADTTAKADLVRNSLTTPALSYLTAIGLEPSRKYYFDLAQLFFFATGLPILFFTVYGDLIITLLLGPSWEIAGEYALFFGFFGAGLVLRGLVNIFHINEFKSKRLYRLNLIFLLVLYPTIAITYFMYSFPAMTFVKIFTLFTFGYWLLTLIYSLGKFTGKTLNALRVLFNIISVTVVFIFCGKWLRSYFMLEDNLEIVEAIIVGFISLSISILFYAAINYNGFIRQFQLIYSRIKK